MTDMTRTPTTHPTQRGLHDTLPDFLTLFASMHDAMRRDMARLERAVAGVDGPPDARALHAWWQCFAGVIVQHHRREDDLVWPALAFPRLAHGFTAEEYAELENRMSRGTTVRSTIAAPVREVA